MNTQPNPFTSLFKSRKFWVFFVSGLSNLVIYFAVKYFAPSLAEDVKMVLAFIDGLAAIEIGSIAWEDNTQTHANAMVNAAIASKPAAPVTPTVSQSGVVPVSAIPH